MSVAGVNEIVAFLKENGSEENRKGMMRFGIRVQNAFGVSMPVLRNFAAGHRRNHELALALWDTGYHEARILAALVADARRTDARMMEQWIKDFNSWDLCDQVCMSLFRATDCAFEKAVEWTYREPEFEKRAGFVMMATLCVHATKAPLEAFELFPVRIEAEACDQRNFVKKAVNWALRQYGKRNSIFHQTALQLALKLSAAECKAARWIGSDAVRELESDKVKTRLINKEKTNNLKKQNLWTQ